MAAIDSRETAWPQEIEDDYARVRPLGEGAYGVVWLARATPRSQRETAHTASDDDSVDPSEREDAFDAAASAPNTNAEEHPYVAIKQIATETEEERKYAAREIAILSEINHPNAVRCLRSVELPHSRLVVLTLADGPDLNELVEAGGALGVSLARLAAQHLIAAVAYLHGRGVMHRDIKPNNCILAKTDAFAHHQSREDWMSNGMLWNDSAIFDDKEWKVVLVDFGFARALTPSECMVKTKEGRKSSMSVRNLFQRAASRQESLVKSESDNYDSFRGKDSSPKAGTAPMRRGASFQRVPIRAMSALGSRAYAAPEVKQVRRKSEDDHALAENVADYGLIADAFSVGCTIKVLLTGVPADKNEMEFIGGQNNVLLNIISALFSCGSKGSGGKRKKRYKFLDEAPKPARDLVKKLMQPKYGDRLTVACARDEPWIKGGMSGDDPVVDLPVGDVPAGTDDPIKCLECAAAINLQ